MRYRMAVCFTIVAMSLIGRGRAMGDEWNPRAKLLKSLVDSVPKTLKTQDKATGRFGSLPWICRDQQVIFALVAAWGN